MRMHVSNASRQSIVRGARVLASISSKGHHYTSYFDSFLKVYVCVWDGREKGSGESPIAFLCSWI